MLTGELTQEFDDVLLDGFCVGFSLARCKLDLGTTKVGIVDAVVDRDRGLENGTVADHSTSNTNPHRLRSENDAR